MAWSSYRLRQYPATPIAVILIGGRSSFIGLGRFIDGCEGVIPISA
jgi:hypothetical protein